MVQSITYNRSNNIQMTKAERFLREQKVLTKFRINCKAEGKNPDEFLKEYGFSPHMTISCGFYWKGSPEGHSFWDKLADANGYCFEGTLYFLNKT